MEVLKYMRVTRLADKELQSKPRSMKFHLNIILMVGLLSMVFLNCSSEQNRSAAQKSEPLEQLDPRSVPLYPAQREAKARDFEVTLINGEKFQLSDQQGKVVILNIWATWCAPCREEIPDFVELYRKYKDEGLMILGVSIDKQGESVVKPFVEKYDINYPIVIDQGTIIDKYGPTMSIPTTYIIGRGGNLQYFAVGALTNRELEPRIKDLLEH